MICGCAHGPRRAQQCVVEPTPADHVCGEHRVSPQKDSCGVQNRRHNGIEPIIRQIIPSTELLIEARTQGAKHHSAKLPISHRLVDVQLKMVLSVVVDFVFVPVVVVLCTTLQQVVDANRIRTVVILATSLYPIEDVLVSRLWIGDNLRHAGPGLIGSFMT